jgi:anti-sigma regulatory factor (Ser/Thr protein kinase)
MRPQYRQAAAELPAGSVLLLYSDGLVERRGRSIDDGLDDLILAAREAPKDPERFLEHIFDRLVGDAPRSDDIALLAACLMPVAPLPLELRIPSTLGALALVRTSLRAWLEGAPVDRAEAESLVLAVWEACVNAVEHAVDPDGAGVLVRAVLAASKVSVLVEDNGRWSPPVNRAGRGFGLQLMRAMSSSVEIVPGGENGGTRVVLELEVAAPTGSPTTAR